MIVPLAEDLVGVLGWRDFWGEVVVEGDVRQRVGARAEGCVELGGRDAAGAGGVREGVPRALGAAGREGLGAPLHLRMAGAILAVDIVRAACEAHGAPRGTSPLVASRAARVRESLVAGAGWRRQAAREAFGAFVGGGGQALVRDGLRKALWTVFERTGAMRTQFEAIGAEGVGVGPGVPILRAWDWAHPGFLDSREWPSEEREGRDLFGAVVRAVESKIGELGAVCSSIRSLDLRVLESQVNAVVNADGCFEYMDALRELKKYSEFDLKQALDFPARLQIMIEVGIGLGCSEDILMKSAQILDESVRRVELNHNIRTNAMKSAQVRGVAPVSMNWAYRVEPIRRVMPALKQIYRNMAAEGSNYIFLDVRGSGEAATPFRMVLDRRYSDQERIEKMLAGLRRVDETPRNGYAAQVYKKREFGDKSDSYIEKSVKERAGWDPDDDLNAIVVGRLPAAFDRDDLCLIAWENGGELSSVFVPSMLVDYANYFGMADTVRVSGYRPHGRWVTFSRRGHAVAHGIGQDEPTPGFSMSDESIRKALELVRSR